MNAITETRQILKQISTILFYHHWANTSAGGLLVPDGIILPVVSVLAPTWLYENLKNLEILNLGWFNPAKYSL